MKILRFFIIILLFSLPISLIGSDTSYDIAKEVQNNINIVWTCIAAFLVFFMQAGFAMVEAGFTRAKNVVNILMKNLMDFSIASLIFFLVGFGLMFGKSNGLFGVTHFGLKGINVISKDWVFTFFIFQTMFAGTAATITSGTMAERTKFIGYMMYSAMITLFIYPIFGSWAWGSLYKGSGWLENLGFRDFAGSTVVHSIGGWLALAGAIILGPRIGKYGPNREPRAIPGHNITLAGLGVFILWFGWFGFNPGSTAFGDGSIGRIAVTTNLAASAGAIGALITSWFIMRKPDATMTLNGVLAGLVAITAGCAYVSPFGSLVIGFIAGILVVVSVLFIDKIMKVDDPVGAVSVHGVCGAFGTLAVGLFAIDGGLFYSGGFKLLGIQALGVLVGFIWAFGLGLLMFKIIDLTVGLRVSYDEELRGLDIGEHGMEAYSGFQIFITQ